MNVRYIFFDEDTLQRMRSANEVLESVLRGGNSSNMYNTVAQKLTGKKEGEITSEDIGLAKLFSFAKLYGADRETIDDMPGKTR